MKITLLALTFILSLSFAAHAQDANRCTDRLAGTNLDPATITLIDKIDRVMNGDPTTAMYTNLTPGTSEDPAIGSHKVVFSHSDEGKLTASIQDVNQEKMAELLESIGLDPYSPDDQSWIRDAMADHAFEFSANSICLGADDQSVDFDMIGLGANSFVKGFQLKLHATASADGKGTNFAAEMIDPNNPATDDSNKISGDFYRSDVSAAQ